MRSWIELVWKTYIGDHMKSVLLLDDFNCHMQESFLEAMQFYWNKCGNYSRGLYLCVAAIWYRCGEPAQAWNWKVLYEIGVKKFCKGYLKLVAASSGEKRSVVVDMQRAWCYSEKGTRAPLQQIGFSNTRSEHPPTPFSDIPSPCSSECGTEIVADVDIVDIYWNL